VTDGQSVSKSWWRAPWPNIYYCLTVTVLLLWGALSDERTGLSITYAAGPCQCSLSRVRVPWGSRPYFTVSDLRLPLSLPPTTRRVTVEVFDPASTRTSLLTTAATRYYSLDTGHIENTSRNNFSIFASHSYSRDHVEDTFSNYCCIFLTVELMHSCLLEEPLPNNGSTCNSINRQIIT
jgi:hypothetical protein